MFLFNISPMMIVMSCLTPPFIHYLHFYPLSFSSSTTMMAPGGFPRDPSAFFQKKKQQTRAAAHVVHSERNQDFMGACALRHFSRQQLFCFSFRKMSEVEETIRRIAGHRGVWGIIVVNHDGIPIRTTLDNVVTVQYAGLITQLAAKARSAVRELDATNDLTFLRLRSKKHEIMVAPDKDYMLIVIQNPSGEAQHQ